MPSQCSLTHLPETTRSADLVSSPNDDLTLQEYFPRSSDLTTGIMAVLIVCTVVMIFEGTSLPSLVHVKWTGFVPEAKVQTSVASPPTDVSGTANVPIFGGTDASDDDKTIKTKKLMISMTAIT